MIFLVYSRLQLWFFHIIWALYVVIFGSIVLHMFVNIYRHVTTRWCAPGLMDAVEGVSGVPSTRYITGELPALFWWSYLRLCVHVENYSRQIILSRSFVFVVLCSGKPERASSSVHRVYWWSSKHKAVRRWHCELCVVRRRLCEGGCPGLAGSAPVCPPPSSCDEVVCVVLTLSSLCSVFNKVLGLKLQSFTFLLCILMEKHKHVLQDFVEFSCLC